MKTLIDSGINLPELINDYGPIIAWALVIIGWWLANNQANGRERRKELRADIDRIDSIVKGLVASHRRYRTGVPGSEDDVESVHIKVATSHLGLCLARTPDQIYTADVKRLQADLFERLTGGDFECATRSALLHSHQSILTVEFSAIQLMDELERAYLKFDA